MIIKFRYAIQNSYYENKCLYFKEENSVVEFLFGKLQSVGEQLKLRQTYFDACVFLGSLSSFQNNYFSDNSSTCVSEENTRASTETSMKKIYIPLVSDCIHLFTRVYVF